MSILREIITKLTLQTDPAKLARFQGMLSDARGQTEKLKASLGGVAGQLAGIAAGVAGGLGFHSITTELAEQTHILNNHSKAVGMTVEEYSRLQAASAQFVEETGKDMRDFLADLADYGRDALANPTGSYAADFKALGVELKDTEGKLKTQFDLFLSLSDAITSVPLTAERMGIVSAVLSSGGLEMAEFLQLGREGILAQMAAVDQAAIVTQNHVKVSKEFRGAMLGVGNVIQGVRVEMGMRLMPVLTKVAQGFTLWWRTADQGPRLLRRIEGGLKLLAHIIAVIVAVKLAVFLRVAVTLTLAWARAAWAAVAALSALQLALIAIPVALATIALLVEDIIVWAEGGDSAIGAFIERFYDAPGILGKVARYLRDHTFQIQAGAQKIAEGFFSFIENAKKAAWVIGGTLTQVWRKIEGMIQGGGPGLRDRMADVYDAIGHGAMGALRAAGAAIKGAVSGALSAAWGWLSAPFVSLGQMITGWVNDLLANEVIAALVRFGAQMFDSLGRILGALWDLVSTIVEGVVRIIVAIWPAVSRLLGAVGKLFGAVVKLVMALAKVVWVLWTARGRIIMSVLKGLWPLISALLAKIASMVETAVSWIVTGVEWVADKVTWVAEKFGSILETVVGWIAEGAEWIASKIEWVATESVSVTAWIIDGVTWLADKVTWLVEWVINAITWVVDKVLWGADMVAIGLGWILDTFVTPLINGLTTAAEWIASTFGDVAEGLKGIFSGAFDAVMTMAKPIIAIIDGLKGTVDWAAEKLGLSDGGRGDEVRNMIAQSQADVQAILAKAQGGQGMAAGATVSMGAAGGRPGTQNSIGTLQVTVQGTTDMGPSDLARATQQGVTDGLTKAAGRDLSVAGGG